MTILELFLIGIGLSMDAFAVAAVSGMCIQDIRFRQALLIALAFGFFQGLMPALGYLAGSVFSSVVSAYAPWIAFILLALVGGKMIYESFSPEQEGLTGLSLRLLLAQAVATSIDALAVGVSFAALQVKILPAAALIACTTFFLSLLAVGVGKLFGGFLAGKAGLAGGVILIIIGLRILLGI